MWDVGQDKKNTKLMSLWIDMMTALQTMTSGPVEPIKNDSTVAQNPQKMFAKTVNLLPVCSQLRRTAKKCN